MNISCVAIQSVVLHPTIQSWKVVIIIFLFSITNHRRSTTSCWSSPTHGNGHAVRNWSRRWHVYAAVTALDGFGGEFQLICLPRESGIMDKCNHFKINRFHFANLKMGTRHQKSRKVSGESSHLFCLSFGSGIH